MEIKRFKETVEAFHYDAKAADFKGENEINVSFAPLDPNHPAIKPEDSVLGVRVEAVIVFDDFVLNARVSQVNHIIGRKVGAQGDLTQEEVDELVKPLFSIIERLTYEVTEIALDQPGVELNFSQNIKK
jgi:hypothetical protein